MNKKIHTAVGAACLLVAPLAIWGQTATDKGAAEDPQNEVLVTATRSSDGVRTDLLGSSFTVIDPIDLQQRQTRIVSDVLRDVPGIAVSRAGTVGGLTQIRMRGAEGNHTLVLIDGIKASDPYQGEFDFATLLADEVARVEVLRGQQSALYGSDAIGGVINYITLSGREAPGLSARLEGGSFGTVDTAMRYGGESGPFDYALSGGYQSTDGVPTSRFGTREVGSNNKVASGRFTYAPTDAVRVKAVARYSRITADSNDQDFSGGPLNGFVIDSDDFHKNRAFYGLVRAELDSLGGRWTNAFAAQGVDVKRDGFSGGQLDYGNKGRRERYSYDSTLRFGTGAVRQSITGAFDYERETFQNTGPFLNDAQALERHNVMRGAVAQYDASINDRIGLGAAVRHDSNDRFDDDTTLRLQGSYRFDAGLRLRAAAGSGIKNPSVFELFGFDPTSFIGNANLKPEKSRGWEVGAEQRFAGDRAVVGVAYFNNKLKDEITTRFLPGFVSTPANLTTRSTQKGAELSLTAHFSPQWRVDGAYTYLDAKELGREEVRRPPHVASLNVAWQTPDERFGTALTLRYNGEMDDNDFRTFTPGARVRLASFTLVNLGGDWRISDNMQVYARIENLFDEDYEEVFTFRTPGRAEYAGVRVTF